MEAALRRLSIASIAAVLIIIAVTEVNMEET